jgi:hypothetical protein
MTVYLTHHKAFCEELGRLHALDVSWDGCGAVPLKRKPLLAAMLLFGRRPDLTLGAKVCLDRGGIDISLFRGARDIQITLCKAGSVLISGHRPGMAPDFLISSSTITESLIRQVSEVIPSGTDLPFLSKKTEEDVSLEIPFEKFVVLRRQKVDVNGPNKLLIGREGLVQGVYAYHDVAHLPGDIYVDQPLTGEINLKELVKAYVQERSSSHAPA